MPIDFKVWIQMCQLADAQMKDNNGHEYEIILKTRCQRCGRSPKQKGKCPGWMNTFCSKLFDEVNKYLEK